MDDNPDRVLEKSQKESLKREIQILESLSSGPLSESVAAQSKIYYFRKLQEAKEALNESRESNIRAIASLMNKLCYGLGLKEEELASMSTEQIRALIEKNNLSPTSSFSSTRLAGMVKMMARGSI